MQKIIIRFLAVYSLIFTSVLGFLVLGDPAGDPGSKAVLTMGLLLVWIWCVVFGSLMYRYRDQFKRLFQKIPLHWQVKFVLFSTLFVLLEEVITVSLTNIVPKIMGVSMEMAYMTASPNYFDTVLGHSAIVILGFILGWGWLLKRYSFTTFEVFILMGLVGSIGEMMVGGAYQILSGFWFFVYGLFVYLPTYSIPKDLNLPRPKWKHYILAIVLPLLMTGPMAVLAWIYRSSFDTFYFPGVL